MSVRRLARTLPLLVAWLGACSALACRREAPPPAPQESTLAPVEPAAPQASRVERDGLSIAFALRALGRGREGVHGASAEAFADAMAEFTLTDAKTGAPARGLSPVGWMSRRAEAAGSVAGLPFGDAGPVSGAALDEAACRAKIKSFSAGLLSVRPEVDMNAYLLWTLNRDSTLSVINPQIAFSKTKLRSVVSLAGPGVSFVLHPDRDSLYVTLRGGQGLAVVDTRRGLVKTNVAVGEDPTRVVVAPDGRTVWVGNDGDGTVSVIDARSSDVLKTLRVGPGHHEVAFTGGGRAAWITSRGAEAVIVVDSATLEPLGEVAVGEGAVSLAASDPAGVVYVANEARGEVVIIDATRRSVAGHIPLKPGLGALRFEPSGRFAFALNPAANEVSLLDASTGAVAHTLTGLAAPDAVAFTDAFAYVRNLGVGRISLIDRATLGGPKAPPIIHVEVGQHAPGAARSGSRPGLRAEEPRSGLDLNAFTEPFAPTPEGNGVLVANPIDNAVYAYVEGMMAPIGTFSNYGREPRSILVEDRSLKEVRPGVYATAVRLGGAGPYDVELYLDRPRTAVCLEAAVAPPSTSYSSAALEPVLDITLEPLVDPDLRLTAGEPATLRFRATAKATPALDAGEMEVLIVRFPAGYRWTGAPRDEGDGLFSVTFTPPVPGEYRLLVAAASRGAPVGTLPFVPLRVFAGSAAAPQGGVR